MPRSLHAWAASGPKPRLALRASSYLKLVALGATVFAAVSGTVSACDSNGTGGSGTGGSIGPGGGFGGSGAGKIDTGDLNCAAPTGEGNIQLALVTSGVSNPVLLKSAPGDKSRLFVLEQGGTIRVIKDGALEPEPFLDIQSIVLFNGGEQGLLGLAFHPNYKANGRFFVYYSDRGTAEMVLAEYKRSSNPDKAEPQAVETLIRLGDPESNHNGGSLEFSPADGMLYVGWGDAGGGDDQHGDCGNGQDKSVLHGKLLRLDVDKRSEGKPYTPAGVVADGAPEVWDYGLRNPWRLSFDGCTGDLYVGDVGQDNWEEINVEPAGKGGKNYGWRCSEGNGPTPTADNSGCPCDASSEVRPALAMSRDDAHCIVGGYVYRGQAMPFLRGLYFFADFSTRRIWTSRWRDGRLDEPVDRTADLGDGALQVSSFGQDGDGEIYIVDYSGFIFRIDPA
jgi:glucose/arabinose dehydrogenase